MMLIRTFWRRQKRSLRPREYMDMEMFFRFFGEVPQLIIVDCTFTASSAGIRV